MQSTTMIESLKPKRPPLGAVWEVYCDGATKESNPSSEGGWGFIVLCNDKLYYAQHGHIVGERVTNQLSELKSIFHALQYCHQKGILTPTIWSDSEFAINSVNGLNTVKNQQLALTLTSIKHYLYFLKPEFKHTPRTREFQKFADFLANLGLVGSNTYNTKEAHIALINSYNTWNR